MLLFSTPQSFPQPILSLSLLWLGSWAPLSVVVPTPNLAGFCLVSASWGQSGEWRVKEEGVRASLPTSLSMCGPISGTISLSTTAVPGEEPCVSSSSQRHPCSSSAAVSSQHRPVLREVVTASRCYGSLSFSASLVGALHLPSLQVELRLSLFTWVIRVNFSSLMGPWQIWSSSCHTFYVCAVSRRDSGYRNVPSVSSHIAASLGKDVLLPLFNVFIYLGKKGLQEPSSLIFY